MNIKSIYILLAFILGASHAYTQTAIWDGKSRYVLLGEQVTLLEDSTKTLGIEQVSSATYAAKFTVSNQKILNFPLEMAVYWVKFTIKNTTKDRLLLEVAQPILPSVVLYYKDSSQQWQSYRAGYTINLYKKDIKHHLPVFQLLGDTSIYYLRIETTTLPMPIKLWNQDTYETKMSNQKLIFGIYMGIMLFIILYNLFLFVSLRRLGYLHYSILIFTYALFAALYDGYILYIFPEINILTWYIFNPIVMQPFGLLYCMLFLNIKKYAPRSYRLAWIFLIYFTLYIGWHYFLPPAICILVSQIHALSGIFLMAYLGIMVGMKGNRLGYYFALAYFIFFAISTIEVIYDNTGYPPYLVELSYISIAFLIEVAILSYLLSKRFEWEKADVEKGKKEAQQQLLEKTLENEKIVREQNTVLEQKVTERTAALKKSLEELKSTQTQLIQSEKLASLGELTAGIAHEIQNPLNFVNNFSELSVDLVKDLKDEIEKTTQDKEYIGELFTDLSQNQEKINHHGKRASGIVKGMLEHSRASTGVKELTDINKLADEYLRLSYHGLRAKDKDFNADFTTDFDLTLPKIEVIPQDIGRVLLNLINNAFYAVNQRAQPSEGFKPSEGYTPSVFVSTKQLENAIEIRVKDNGTGMPESVRAKVFQPFFTTKPTGQGTGLGLSLAYDIVTKGHGGTLEVESEEGKGTTFTIKLSIK